MRDCYINYVLNEVKIGRYLEPINCRYLFDMNNNGIVDIQITRFWSPESASAVIVCKGRSMLLN